MGAFGCDDGAGGVALRLPRLSKMTASLGERVGRGSSRCRGGRFPLMGMILRAPTGIAYLGMTLSIGGFSAAASRRAPTATSPSRLHELSLQLGPEGYFSLLWRREMYSQRMEVK